MCFISNNTSKILKEKGYEVVPRKKLVDYYLHKYNSYKEYKEAQIKLNKKKIDLVWADENTLKKDSNLKIQYQYMNLSIRLFKVMTLLPWSAMLRWEEQTRNLIS